MNTENGKDLPTISVITISLNDVNGLSRTISSVTNQVNAEKQFIVIDGDSTDGTKEFLAKNTHHIDKLITEKDVGVYHAMNKGLELADGEWVVFMNAGDIFSSNEMLCKLTSNLDANTDVIYADWFYSNSDQVVKANIEKLNVRHQSVLYRKSLHSTYGNYLVGKNVSISDYLFFLSIRHLNWKYFVEPLSICEQDGISARPSHFYQRILSECLFGKRSNIATAVILVLYPLYRFFKRSILRIS